MKYLLRIAAPVVLQSCSLAVGAECVGAAAAALMGIQPYAEAAEQGWRLPPTEQDVQALSPLEYKAQRTALKRLLLLRCAKAYRAAGRETDADLRACSRYARKTGAPQPAAFLLELMADESTGVRQRYTAARCLSVPEQLFRVDALMVRYFTECAGVDEKVFAVAADWLPWDACFNMVPKRGTSPLSAAADCRYLASWYAEVAAKYAEVNDTATADAAADALVGELPAYDTTAYTRLYADVHELAALQQQLDIPLNAVASEVAEQRKRLRDNGFFGSVKLRMFDFLLG